MVYGLYIYTPWGNRKGRLIKYRNLFITFLVSGLWHGAAYTFVLWGALHGIYMVVEDILRTEYRKIKDLYGTYKPADKAIAILSPFVTFGFVMFAFILFRANSISDVSYIFSHIFWDFRKWNTIEYLYQMITSLGMSLYELKVVFIAVLVLFVSEGLAGHDISGYIRKKGFVPEVLYYAFIFLFILTAGYSTMQESSYTSSSDRRKAVRKNNILCLIKILAVIIIVVPLFNYFGSLYKSAADKNVINAFTKQRFDDFYALEENSLDMVFLGSSHSYCTFDPEIIDSGLNLNSFQMGTPLQHRIQAL